MKSQEKMVCFCSYAGKIASGGQWGLYGLIVDEAGIDMPEPIQTIRLQQVAAAPSETAAAAGPSAQSAAERETETMDVSPDTQLDEQIREDLAAAQESNLLTGE